MGSKTGTGPRQETNDVGIFWPPGRPPLLVAAYLADATVPDERRNSAVAAVAAHVTRSR